MFRDNSAVAIDIGSKAIKIVHGKTRKNGVWVVDYGICDTPRDTCVDGNIKDKRDIIKAISDLIKDRNFRSKYAIIGVKGQDIIIRHIEMPLMSEKQLKQAVKLEIQQYLPMDPNEYVIDSKIINKVDTKEKKAFNVLLVAAPKGKIADHYYIGEKLGFKVKAIDLFANSVTRFFEENAARGNSEDTGKCVGLMDIGYETSTITMVEGGKLFLERELGIGVKHIDAMVKKVYAAESEDVETIRDRILTLIPDVADEKSDDPRVYYANNNARQIIDGLIDNVLKVFDFYISSGFNKTVDSLYIYGGGAKIKGLMNYIKASVNVHTEVFHGELLSDSYKIHDEFKKDLDMYVNCLGLLLRKE